MGERQQCAPVSCWKTAICQSHDWHIAVHCNDFPFHFYDIKNCNYCTMLICAWPKCIQSKSTVHKENSSISFFFLWRCDPTRVMASSFLRFLDQTQRCTTVGRTPLDEWSARCRDLYLTTHNTHNRLWWDSNPRSQQASGRRRTP